MFQKWMIAFLADRGWRYLRQRQTRKQLQQILKNRSKWSAKKAKQKQAKREQGFRPGRALALLALGVGAWAYVRSRQSNNQETESFDAFNYSASKPKSSITNVPTPNENSTASEALAPTYQEQASMPQNETLAVAAGSAQTEEPAYDAQAASAESTLAVSTTAEETNEPGSVSSESSEDDAQELRGSGESGGSTTDQNVSEQQNL